MKRWLWWLSGVLLLAGNTFIQGAGLIVVSDPDANSEVGISPRPLPPSFPHPRPIPPPFMPPPGRHFAFAPLELSSLQVRTQIKEQVATTSLEEEFYNPNP